VLALLSFSFDPNDPLLKLRKELKEVQRPLTQKDWTPVSLWMAGSDEIIDVIEKKQQEVRVFHFAGHALGSHIQLNDDLEVKRNSFVEALAKRICKYGGIKLVFLNGCSTVDQAQAFLDQQTQAVIATERPLKDKYGLAFARMFYQEFCERGKSLRESFDDAINNFLTDFQANKVDWDDTDLIESIRGGVVVDEKEEDSKPLYRLQLHPGFPDIGNETFASWLSPVKAPQTIPIVSPGAVKNMGISSDSYLLCNRRTEAGTFLSFAKSKLEGTLAQPVFFFIHDQQQNCPFELSERFRLYSLKEISKSIPNKKSIELEPVQSHFSDKDKFKLALSELYHQQFPGAYDEALNRYRLPKISPDNDLLLIYHDLSFLDWEEKWADFFSFYTGEYAQILGQELSQRLVVLCLREYYDDSDPFQQFFSKIASDHPSNVFSFTNLEEIKKMDIGRWQRDVLGQTFFDVNDLFTVNGQHVSTLSFLKTKEKLAEQINLFNLQKVHGAKPE
jgi:hypothetical protein